MKAVIETGGKQYYVEEGTELYIETVDVEPGKTFNIEHVLMLNGISGRPYLNNVVVEAEVLKHGKGKKIKIFKYVQKNNYHKTQGHRQPYTKVVIKKIIEK